MQAAFEDAVDAAPSMSRPLHRAMLVPLATGWLTS
jgi:hypothetical protein